MVPPTESNEDIVHAHIKHAPRALTLDSIGLITEVTGFTEDGMIALTTGNLVAGPALMPTYVEFRTLESLMSHKDVRRNRTRGQVMLLVTVALIPMLGLVGLVSDIGYMQYVQKSAHTAADAASRSAVAR